ncbi:sodium hydrogen exchanger isoform A [Chlorella sorokiniana]|uniref:Sodium hydrogen exchanger isoform A n=1 Tax=Chlorella sorokiniana TaxID=3076 RepID=A0A2P6U364_CHLSO|nr:sodium hydrogen exchanger isoform A [Chlorella sorokiniana]|eukprot:PRW60756.1 sodium hydrogen exchanger isoform A [Chlorella sorokiniana]
MAAEANQPSLIPAVSAVYFVVVSILIGLATVTVGGLWPSTHLPSLPVPYTALQLVFGLLVGFCNVAGGAVAYISDGITAWQSINPSLIFAVFLPTLVMASALELNWHMLKRAWANVALLAFVGTFINAVLITIVGRFVMPYSWSWSEAGLLGSILSATDPVAVTALMSAVGASERLQTVIAGESLVNDGVAFVLFEIAEQWQAGDRLTAGSVIGFTFKASFGGAGMGIAFGLAASLLLSLMFDNPVGELWVIVVAAYSLFMVTDEILGLSAMLALVACGMVVIAFGRAFISPRAQPFCRHWWRWADWTANTLIFFLSGALIASEVYKSSTLVGKDWGWAVALWALLLAIRAAGITLLYPLTSRLGYGMNWRDAIIVTWAGLRGAVGLVLALSVRNSEDLGSQEFRERLFFFVSLQALLTVVLQGTTMQPLLRVLGFLDLSGAERAVQRAAAQAVDEYGKQAEGELEQQRQISPWQALLGEPDWQRVDALGELGVEKLLEGRPGAAATTVSLEERIEDLRTRALCVTLGAYEEMYDAQFLSPPTFNRLKDATDAAMDGVGSRFDSWRCLQARFGWLARLQRVQARLPRSRWLAWARAAVSAARRISADREVAATAAFVLAHRYAATHLAALLDSAAAAQQAKSLGVSWRQTTLGQTSGMISGTTGWRPLLLTDVEDIDWAHRDALLADVLSNLHRSGSPEQQQLREQALDSVLAEMRQAEAAAAAHLQALRAAHPHSAQRVVTLQTAIALLDRKVDLLAALQSAGMLEQRESACEQAVPQYHTTRQALRR